MNDNVVEMIDEKDKEKVSKPIKVFDCDIDEDGKDKEKVPKLIKVFDCEYKDKIPEVDNYAEDRIPLLEPIEERPSYNEYIKILTQIMELNKLICPLKIKARHISASSTKETAKLFEIIVTYNSFTPLIDEHLCKHYPYLVDVYFSNELTLERFKEGPTDLISLVIISTYVQNALEKSGEERSGEINELQSDIFTKLLLVPLDDIITMILRNVDVMFQEYNRIFNVMFEKKKGVLDPLWDIDTKTKLITCIMNSDDYDNKHKLDLVKLVLL